MSFGIHTFETHLDLIGQNALANFNTWNAGAGPSFAGRNFLGGNFIWGHSEATNSLNAPNPYRPQDLTIEFPLIAPIQAAQPDRQKAIFAGLTLGAIDAYAICKKIAKSLEAGEFRLPARDYVYVWLEIEDGAAISGEYLAGWADQVYNYEMATVLGSTSPLIKHRPFCPCIICPYNYNSTTGLFERDPGVNIAVQNAKHYSNKHTWIYAYWAIAPFPDSRADKPGSSLDWSLFKGGEEPDIWDFSVQYTLADGFLLNFPFKIDALPDPNLTERIPLATEYMLHSSSWQPSGDNIQNVGFSTLTRYTDQLIINLRANPLPPIRDHALRNPNIGRGFTVPGGPVNIIGRYLLRINSQRNQILQVPEAERLSNAGIEIFSVWQRQRGNVPSGDENYFNPALNGGRTGYLDGMEAFEYCGNTLKQPPQTPIFFAVDFDYQTNRRNWITTYFEGVRDARIAYLLQNPNRYYLIGVYGSGAVLRWCYEQGIVSYFWQAVSSGYSGSGLNHFPWYHANRWQYQREANIPSSWTVDRAADPDADWGDGGTWILTDPLAINLQLLEALGVVIKVLFQKFGDLLD
jgi:hypothetical protein